MVVKVLRGENGISSGFESYEVPITKQDRYTALDILKYIYENLDSSLAFFSHSVCNHGICGRCAMKINGKVKLSCTYLVTENELILEPKNKKVVRDLVTEP